MTPLILSLKSVPNTQWIQLLYVFRPGRVFDSTTNTLIETGRDSMSDMFWYFIGISSVTAMFISLYVERALFIPKVYQAVNKFILLSLNFCLLNYSNQGGFFYLLFNSCLSHNIVWAQQRIVKAFVHFPLRWRMSTACNILLKHTTHTRCPFSPSLDDANSSCHVPDCTGS